ncbi:hypothetical protein ED208_04280 [Stagnimonas aquatica]|uniref:Pyridoxamine 5'-phosphate oxidase putative domain-containing protein n=1 Tax=Stagnimonas aquatica TaxID=2689987 RepID=A0A3N0VLW7_9GAMM|nr:hypothetical protein [Stagnimonas aquatica]ROH93747.1 hypothetical protein ED208_04280 [Stagnimonas aquatica]
MPSRAAALTLAAEHQAFIQGGVSITAGSVNAEHLPSMARAIGCAVNADGRQVRLLFCPVRAGGLLADIAAGGRVAVTFSQPTSNRTLQLKGRDARVEAGSAEDEALRERYARAFVADLAKLHFPEALVRVLLQVLAPAPVAVVFQPEAAYSQTPGPGAGAALP